MQLDAKATALILITARSAAEHGYELVVAEDLGSALDADMHAFSFRHIPPRLARITSSEGVALG